MTQVKGIVSSEALWGVICDELHDEHPHDRVRWLREHHDPITVGMVWRAAPRLRGLIEGRWPEMLRPETEPLPIEPYTRLLLVESEVERDEVRQALPDGFTRRALQGPVFSHPHHGRVAVAVRNAEVEGDSQWPRWSVLYQQRWGLEIVDHQLAQHTHLPGKRFVDGGLTALLQDLQGEVDRLAVLHDELDRVVTENVRRTRAEIERLWPGGVQEQRYRTDDGAEGATPPPPGWTFHGVDMSAMLRALLGGEVEIERDPAYMLTLVRWEGVRVAVSDGEGVAAPRPEALARDIVRRLVEARQARAVDGIHRGRFTDDVARVRTLTVWEEGRQLHSLDYTHIWGCAPGDVVQLTLWTNDGFVDVVVDASRAGSYLVEYEGRTLRGAGVRVEWQEAPPIGRFG